ncbi:MAG TPA: dienelactone hydrolase family protein [Kofleriaceae bacterium]|nr:dienelactone hydrolase family protein [Kofleriaceae bacterium]
MRIACLALACTLACSSSTSPSPGSTTPESHRPSDTGAVSEAEFKAMHAAPTAGPATRKGEMIDLAGTRAYLSLPAGNGPFPAIVVIHEWWGLNANIEHWADRFTSLGWAAIAVDLYHGKVATTPDEALATMKAASDTEATATIAAAIDFVAKDPRIQATKRVVIGWCFGGGWSLQTALAHPELDGAIIYYGQLETDPAKLSAIKGRVLGFFGERDKGIPPATVQKFEAALKQAGVRAEIHEYDADHAFANPSNPKYDEAHAGDAWKHVVAFLDAIRRADQHD